MMHLRENAPRLFARYGDRVGLAVIRSGCYSSAEIEEFTGIPAVGEVPSDPMAAAVATGETRASAASGDRSSLRLPQGWPPTLLNRWLRETVVALASGDALRSRRRAGRLPKTKGSQMTGSLTSAIRELVAEDLAGPEASALGADDRREFARQQVFVHLDALTSDGNEAWGDRL